MAIHSNILNKEKTVPLLCSLAGVFLFIYTIYNTGLGFTNDSIEYFSAAWSLKTQGVLLKSDGNAFIEWPPLFPIFINLFLYLPFKPYYALIAVNLIIYALNVYLYSRLAQRLIKNKIWQTFSYSFILLSFPLLECHLFLWSEGLFILLMYFFITANITFIEKQTYTSFLFILSSTILLVMQRKVGVLFIPVFSMLYLVLCPQVSLIKKLSLSSFYTLTSLMVFYYFNLSQDHFETTYDTPVLPFIEMLKNNILQTLDVTSSWILPIQIPLLWRLVISVLIITTIIFTGKNIPVNYKSNTILVLTSCVALYLFSLFVLLSILSIEMGMDNRLLSVIYYPSVIILCSILGNIQWKFNNKVLYIFLIGLSLYPILRIYTHCKRWHQGDAGGYSSNHWKNNSLIDFISHQRSSEIIYTNHTLALKYFINFKQGANTQVSPINHLSDRHFKKMIVCFTEDTQYTTGSCRFNQEYSIFKSTEGEIFEIKE